MPIENRNLGPGTRLTATYKKIEYSAVILEDGRVRVDSDAAQQPVFKSLSAAGSAIMGGIACNGWRFWSVDGEAKPASEKAATNGKLPSPKREAEKARTATPLIKRVPNQQGVPEGHLRIFCSACMKSHIVEGTTLPAGCPEGHTPAMFEEAQ